MFAGACINTSPYVFHVVSDSSTFHEHCEPYFDSLR